MGDMLACLRGWHPGLAKAELAALMPDARLVSEASTRWVTTARLAVQLVCCRQELCHSSAPGQECAAKLEDTYAHTATCET